MVDRFYNIILSIAILDQLTKWIIATTTPSLQLLPFFSIVTVKNFGAGFGILQGKVITLTLISLLVLGGILWYKHKMQEQELIPFALITGGLIGNLIDRVFRGHVIDFLDFFIGSYHWPAFNIADIALVVGVGLLVYIDSKNKK